MAIHMLLRLPWWFSGKKKKKKTNLPANARDADSIRGLGRPRGVKSQLTLQVKNLVF